MFHNEFLLELVARQNGMEIVKKGTDVCLIKTAGACQAGRLGGSELGVAKLKKGSEPICSGLLLFTPFTQHNHVIFRCKLIS